MTTIKYTDHLKEYIEGLVTKVVDEHSNSLPPEFEGIDHDKLIYLITDLATPVLRKIEDDAIEAGIQNLASLIRYSMKTRKTEPAP